MRCFFGPRVASHGREGRKRSSVRGMLAALGPGVELPGDPELPPETPKVVEPPGPDTAPGVAPEAPERSVPEDVPAT